MSVIAEPLWGEDEVFLKTVVSQNRGIQIRPQNTNPPYGIPQRVSVILGSPLNSKP